MEARFYEKLADQRVRCTLCPRYCEIGAGQSGFCFIRKNEHGTLVSLAYANPYAVQVDPIEKKPLAHFLPGTQILSLGTAGCNLGCKFCQNWDISKAKYDQQRAQTLWPEQVVQLALAQNCPSIAFTYNEPTIWAEYAIDIAKVAHEYGLKTVMVTAGYVSLEALPEIYEHIDAANIDLKGFTENFYRKTCLAHLQPVLETIKQLKQRGTTWIEITNLIIPTLNDARDEIRELCLWLLEYVGPEVPLHFTAFHPDYRLMHLPRTPSAVLEEARLLAMDLGMHYVYVGNMHTREGNNTYCPQCRELLIERSWHNVRAAHITGSACPQCGHPVPLVLNANARQNWRALAQA